MVGCDRELVEEVLLASYVVAEEVSEEQAVISAVCGLPALAFVTKVMEIFQWGMLGVIDCQGQKAAFDG